MSLVLHAWSEQSLGTRLLISYFNTLFYNMLIPIRVSILDCSLKACGFLIMSLLFQIVFMGLFIVLPKCLL